ncbi:methyl-accepting chemotaxis protein [Virgibacillus oceani]|uniref:Chemotaxis protein n=1 Tax=Virgibacillus oceani TaxID=1479511 RepID=A0A917H206_9BACI|nr:methyl-accepting chemotaxis protein [Virgibacillus oceani]GGG65066.1 hypothetical protein GCM10011398_05870 [Virgibacillus oceani]
MSIKKRLFIFTLIPFLLSLALILFIIIQMDNLQKSSNNDVQLLLEVKELNGEFITAKQALSNYAFNPSEGTGAEITTNLTLISNKLSNVKEELKTNMQEHWFKRIQGKYEQLIPVIEKALLESDTNEIKRQSAKTAGVLNDVYMLQRGANLWYESTVDQRSEMIKNIIHFTIIASLVLIAATVFSIIRLTVKTAKPIRQLAGYAEQVAKGDLTVTIDSAEKGKNEIGLLTNSFIQMIENLKTTILTVNYIGKEVKTFSADLSRNMNVLTDSANQVSTSTEELSKGSQSVSEDIQDVSFHMEKLDTKFVENVHSSNNSTQASEASLQLVDEGQQFIKQQRSTMEKSIVSTQRIKDSVQSFVGYATNIEDTAKLVNEIAEQTNLLALNAAIEAARAGEHGKGFAVVAQEVRKLADESANATTQIFKMIEQIHAGIRNIEEVTEQTSLLSEEQSESMGHTEQSFSAIYENVTAIANQLKQLSEDMATSGEMSSSIVASIQNISAVTEETAAGTEEISASVEDQQQSFIHVNKQVNQLEKMIEELDQQLMNFTL